MEYMSALLTILLSYMYCLPTVHYYFSFCCTAFNLLTSVYKKNPYFYFISLLAELPVSFF